MNIQNSEFSNFLINANTEAVILIGANHIIRNINILGLNLLLKSEAGVLGTNLIDYFSDASKAKKSIDSLFLDGLISKIPLALKQTPEIDLYVSGNIYQKNKESPIGALVLVRKNKTQETESLYVRTLIEASRDPLFTVSPKGEITDINNASIEVTGVSRKELVGSNFMNYFTEPKKARKGYQEVFLKGFVNDYPLTIKDGHFTDVLFNGSVYKNKSGEVVGALVIARDITEQKRVEKELTEAKIFAELATVFADDAKLKAEASAHAAEDALKAKQQFLTNMSHEIRTPMNAIIGFTKVLIKTDLSAKQREYLNAIKMSGDALIVLINDILDLAKVEAGKMSFEKSPFKMAYSISSMLHLFETKIQEKNLKLTTHYDPAIPEVLVGDSIRLHQIILNLVSNAVKFTNKGEIKVEVNLLNEDEKQASVEFRVSDTGIGIAENKLEQIFENFQQASSGTSRLYGGTGLGLAIVKQLVTNQNGTITVQSELGVGSTFCFVLSYIKTKAKTAAPSDLFDLDPRAKNIRVLVVEDIPLNQLLMKTILDEFGFEREIASNGKIAIELLSTNRYDIILMDLQMPEMNGFETTEYIRNTLHSSIPIIALTADVTTVDLDKCQAIGMNDYIAKPVDDKLLYSKILSLLKETSLVVESNLSKTPIIQNRQSKYVDLGYLDKRTKSNPILMMEMIGLYLEQTPTLINAMKQSLQNEDWSTLHSAVHKMLPSFLIMGINSDFESKAKKIQDYAVAREQMEGINQLVDELEFVCLEACKELEIEYYKMKSLTK